MVGFWNTVLCAIWPWHRWAAAEQVSDVAMRVVCTRCGRQYAYNHDLRAVLPWSDVEGFYRNRRRMPL